MESGNLIAFGSGVLEVITVESHSLFVKFA